jgi:hypothetical protein
MCHGQRVESGIDAYAQEANAPNVILPNIEYHNFHCRRVCNTVLVVNVSRLQISHGGLG